MRLVDSHCHLQADRFDPDVELVVGAARLAGVERILVPGWDAASSAAAVELAERLDWPDAAAGIHPHDAARAGDADWASIVQLARDPRVVAIGETGLDYDRMFSPVEDQLANLRRHLRLAVDTGKPAILHCRSAAGRTDAHEALLTELRAAEVGEGGAVMHSFSGPVRFGEAVLDLGLAFSFSGLAFRRGEEASAEVARLVPRDRLLVETDAPYLSPPGAPRKRNEPEWVRVTAAWVAEQREESPESFGDGLVQAYDRLFRR